MGAFPSSFSTLYPQEDIVMYLTSKKLAMKMQITITALNAWCEHCRLYRKKKSYFVLTTGRFPTQKTSIALSNLGETIIRQI